MHRFDKSVLLMGWLVAGGGMIAVSLSHPNLPTLLLLLSLMVAVGLVFTALARVIKTENEFRRKLRKPAA